MLFVQRKQTEALREVSEAEDNSSLNARVFSNWVRVRSIDHIPE